MLSICVSTLDRTLAHYILKWSRNWVTQQLHNVISMICLRDRGPCRIRITTITREDINCKTSSSSSSSAAEMAVINNSQDHIATGSRSFSLSHLSSAVSFIHLFIHDRIDEDDDDDDSKDDDDELLFCKWPSFVTPPFYHAYYYYYYIMHK